MECIGVVDCGTYSTKYATVQRKSRQASDAHVVEEPVADRSAAMHSGTFAHWSKQLPSTVGRFAEKGADVTLLLLLDVHVPQHEKENLLHLAFESIGCQKTSLGYTAATSLFAVGQVSGVTVDVGYAGVRVTPVTRGVVETTHAFTSRAVGAARVDASLQEAFSITGALASPENLTAVKAHLCAIEDSSGGDSANEAATYQEDIRLPDGQTLSVSVPHDVQQRLSQRLLWSPHVSVPHAFRECCESIAVATGEVYPWLLTGGSSAQPHVRTALSDALAVSAVCADAASSRAKTPGHAAVEGGVILSQLSTFKGMCVTAEVYAEEGPQRCAHMKIVDYR